MAEINRRGFGKLVAGGALAAAAAPVLGPDSTLSTARAAGRAQRRARLTGADMYTARNWQVAGTDLGIPYVLENGSIGYLFGDTFSTMSPEGGGNHRSPVMLRSAKHPNDGIVFDSAAKVRGNAPAPELIWNAHGGNVAGQHEFTVIPNDGISFPETGRQVVSFMSMDNWKHPRGFRSGFAGLAYSDNGNDFKRVPAHWFNTPENTNAFQMWTMQRDGDFVYVFSVCSGRQHGPMMLQRVHWTRILDKNAYEGWGWNGSNWGWGRPCTPILHAKFGEPSVRKLKDGTWVMAYVDYGVGLGQLVTRTASRPDGRWSEPVVQIDPITPAQYYGGFIHPWSTSEPGGLHMMVSQWLKDPNKVTKAYHVEHWVGSV